MTESPSNARLLAELQAVQIGLVIVGGDLAKLPEVMRPVLGRFCQACQAIPIVGYCKLADCPHAPTA